MSRSGSGDSSWVNVQTCTPTLNDVMSEELAVQLENENFPVASQNEGNDLSKFLTTDDNATSSDLLLAQMMQDEFDREHDKEMMMLENKLNSERKVKVSYQSHPAQVDEDNSDEEVEEREEITDARQNVRRRGVSKAQLFHSKYLVNQHDVIQGRHRNTKKVKKHEKNEKNLTIGNRARNHPFEVGALENEEEKTSPANQLAPNIEARLGEGSTDHPDWSTTVDRDCVDNDFEIIENTPELNTFEFVKKSEVSEDIQQPDEIVAMETTTCTKS